MGLETTIDPNPFRTPGFTRDEVRARVTDATARGTAP